MDLQNIKSKLDKVNRFYAYLEANQDIISKIDRDALLAAIRSLYEACFEEETTAKIVSSVDASPVQDIPKKEIPVVKKKKTTVVFTTPTPQEKVEEVAPKKVEPKVEKAETPKVEPIKEEPKVEKIVPKTVVVEPKPIEKVELPNPAASIPVSSTFNEEYDDIFMFKAATDISQKLSAAPIPDLSKALGLNEKFLYINELFGGDVSAFQSAIQVFNEANDFDEARRYMEAELIAPLEWHSNKDKKKVTKDFIKLIRRRYL